MNQAQRIIEKFGTPADLHKATGIAQTTIQRWIKSGYISAKRQSDVLRAAKHKGIALTEADFFEKADAA